MNRICSQSPKAKVKKLLPRNLERTKKSVLPTQWTFRDYQIVCKLFR